MAAEFVQTAGAGIATAAGPRAPTPRIPLWRALLPALCVALALLGGVHLLRGVALPQNGYSVPRIEARPSQAPAHWTLWYDEAPDAWRSYTLPVRICRIRCATPYTAWRHRFQADPQRDTDLAVYVPHASTNAAFYLNGTLVAMDGRMTYPPSAHRFTSRLIRLPPSLLRRGENVLSWRIAIEHRGIGGMESLYVGPHAELAPAQRALRLLGHDLVLGALWWQIGALLFALGVFVRGSREPPLRWFLAGAPFWLLLSAWHVAPDLIGPVWLRYAVLFSALFGVVAFSSMFALSMLRPPPPWARRAALAYVGFGVCLAFGAYLWPELEGPVRYSIPNRALRYSALLILPLTLWLLLAHLNRNRDAPLARWVFAAAAIAGACGLHDTVSAALGQRLLYSLTAVGGLGIATAFLLEMGRRVLDNRRAMAEHNQRLNALVAEKEAELRANFERLREAEIERSLAGERARIMRDMHDGVGGQLAALLRLAEEERIGRNALFDALRAGLADLRLVLDSLDQTDHDLLIALSVFRERAQALLRGSGIQLQWRQSPALAGHGYGPEATLQIYRILQEALANAVRHAGAGWIEIDVAPAAAPEAASATGSDRSPQRLSGGHAGIEVADTATAATPWLRVSVRDDGRGFDARAAVGRSRYGLGGMRQRALRLGGQLRIDAAPGSGTRIELWLPLPPGRHDMASP